MTKLLLSFLSVMLLVGCSEIRQVDFVWFNLSDHEIVVTGISGLPPTVAPGVLVTVSDDTNRLNRAGVTLFESVHVADAIKIVWEEGGLSREFETRRLDLSLPSRLDEGQIKFTYLGDGKWRVRFVRQRV